MEPIDIFITTYLRKHYTEQTIRFLHERTDYPFRLFVIDNGGNDDVLEQAIKLNLVYLVLKASHNIGIHGAWNVALSMAESKYFITSDNDIYVPDLRDIAPFNKEYGLKGPCWLERMVTFMEKRPDYGAISLHPHVFIGAASIDPNDPEDVKERNMCGAVMRIMRTDAVRESGGWEHVIRTSRNHEEQTICSKLQAIGYKTGVATRIRAYHPFGKGVGGNWGYPEHITPEMQGHNPALREEVLRFDDMDAYNNKTWLPK